MELCTSCLLVITLQYDMLDFLFPILLGTVSDEGLAFAAGWILLGGRFHSSRRPPPLLGVISLRGFGIP